MDRELEDRARRSDLREKIEFYAFLMLAAAFALLGAGTFLITLVAWILWLLS